MLGNLLKLYVKENERSAGMNMRDDRTIKLLYNIQNEEYQSYGEARG